MIQGRNVHILTFHYLLQNGALHYKSIAIYQT